MINVMGLIDRVVGGEDAKVVVGGVGEGKEKDGEGESLRERAERFLGTRGDKRS